MISSTSHFAASRFANASQIFAVLVFFSHKCFMPANDEINLMKIINLRTIPFIFLWIWKHHFANDAHVIRI